MIHEVNSTLAQFKLMTFTAGLNLVLATKSNAAPKKQSWKGAGKTSLIETIHFLLGANADPNGLFRSNALGEHDFSMKFDLFDGRATVSRRGSAHDEITVESSFPFSPDDEVIKYDTASRRISNAHWNTVLGQAFFELDPSDESNFRPTFCNLFPYFARRERSGGFLNPLKPTRRQSTFYSQVATSRLLGLDERISQDFEVHREKTKLFKVLRKATRGAPNRYVQTEASLKRDLSTATSRALKLKEEINSFTVVEEYEHLEKEADQITQSISSLNDQNTLELQHIRLIEESVESETPPRADYVEKVFRDAGVLLESSVKKRYEDVQKFYLAVTRNRKQHLAAELTDARERLDKRNCERESLDLRRKQIMNILSSGGALKHFNQISEELARCEATIETLKQKLDDVVKLESTQTELKSEKSKLQLALQTDHQERGIIIRQAVQTFEDLSNALFQKAGQFSVRATSDGPKFIFEKSEQASKGINNMQIFCFDLMLMNIVAKRGLGPGFLIHDSHLFDGVDERQVARALQLGARQSEENGFQYIVTLNSDVVPSDGFEDGFKIQDYIQDVQLSDAEESGGLFGIDID